MGRAPPIILSLSAITCLYGGGYMIGASDDVIGWVLGGVVGLVGSFLIGTLRERTEKAESHPETFEPDWDVGDV